MKTLHIGAITGALLLGCTTASAAPKIAPGVESASFTLDGEQITISRNGDEENRVSTLYNTTNRGVPQPMVVEPGVETIGEVEFVQWMQEASEDDNIIIVDTRTPGWYARLRIPGAINVPHDLFIAKESAVEALEDEFGVTANGDALDFSEAKTIVAYCNGYWCGQTPAMFKHHTYSLLSLGYPKDKMKYYRGGMQAWTSLGFTTAGDAASDPEQD